jgi:hypothetical protein
MHKGGFVKTCGREDTWYELAGRVDVVGPDVVGPRVITALVWAKDEQHAIKIVNEHRARLIAEGEF